MTETNQGKKPRDILIHPDFMRCPACQGIIEDPVWRLRCIFKPSGLPCANCAVMVKLVGDHFYGLLFGGGFLVLGGRLFAQGYSILLTGLFFILGVAALGWGILRANLKLVT